MKIVISCSPAERAVAEDVSDWIRDGEFDADIDISIESK